MHFESAGLFAFWSSGTVLLGGVSGALKDRGSIPAGEVKPIQQTLAFESHVFVARRFELAEIQSILEQQNPAFTIDGYSFAMENAQLTRSHFERSCSNNPWSNWPTFLLELRSDVAGKKRTA